MRYNRKDILEPFKKEHRELCYARAKVLCYLGFTFSAIFAITDFYYFSKGNALYFLLLRLIIAALIILIYICLVAFKEMALKRSSIFVLLLASSVGVVLVPMCLKTGGFASFHCSGFIFILLTVAGICPWHAGYQLLLSFIIYIIYFSQSAFVGFDVSQQGFFSYSWMICAVGFLTTLTSYMQYLLRFRLQDAQAELVRSETLSAVGKLAAGVAHNVNTYMSGADMGLSVILERSKGDLKLNKIAKISLESVRNTKAIVSTLENFSQKNRKEYQPASIEDGIESAIRMLKLQPKGAEVLVHKDFRRDSMIRCNLQQFITAFLNLMENAVQSGSKDIWIQTRHKDGKVFLSIKDNGSGIQPEIRRRIFEPFFTTRDIGEGSGLGLWTVYQTVKEHGGKISVNSEVGKGSEFEISLPRGVSSILSN